MPGSREIPGFGNGVGEDIPLPGDDVKTPGLERRMGWEQGGHAAELERGKWGCSERERGIDAGTARRSLPPAPHTHRERVSQPRELLREVGAGVAPTQMEERAIRCPSHPSPCPGTGEFQPLLGAGGCCSSPCPSGTRVPGSGRGAAGGERARRVEARRRCAVAALHLLGTHKMLLPLHPCVYEKDPGTHPARPPSPTAGTSFYYFHC